MLFSPRLSLLHLIELCRTLRHNLGAGLTLQAVFRQLATRGTQPVRLVSRRISEIIDRGDNLEDALKVEKASFPPLFVSLAIVGERSGNLPEIMGEMEKFFFLQYRLKRQFYSQITLPVLQFFAAIFIIAGMLWVLGVVAASQGSQPMDLFGVGAGAQGALTFLGIVFGTLALLIAFYFLTTRVLQHQALAEELLLRTPILGACMMNFALSRFCLALRLTLETGMHIAAAAKLCLRATGSAAFESRTDVVIASLKQGDSLSEALGGARIFPEEFLNIVAVAEEGGRLVEVMIHQATFYEEEASRSLTALSRAAGYGVYAVYVILMVFAIFTIAKKAYIDPLSQI